MAAKNQEAPEAFELREATAHHAEVRARMRALEEKLEGLQLARTLAVTGGTGQMPDHLRDRAAPYLEMARRRPKRLDVQIEDTKDQIDELAPAYRAASERRDTAMRRETNRQAIALQPKHREIAKRMARAVEELSAAIADERQLLAEFAKQAPLPQSCHLPNVGGGLGTGTLSDFDSPLWRWRKQIAALNILEN